MLIKILRIIFESCSNLSIPWASVEDFSHYVYDQVFLKYCVLKAEITNKMLTFVTWFHRVHWKIISGMLSISGGLLNWRLNPQNLMNEVLHVGRLVQCCIVWVANSYLFLPELYHVLGKLKAGPYYYSQKGER